MTDRRRAARAAIELTVEYKRLNTFFADYTRNISQGGTFIRTERPLDIGTEFVFALRVRSLDEPLRLTGCVRWTVSPEQADDDQPAGMGIEFQYETDDEREETAQVVRDLMVRELGEEIADKLLSEEIESDDSA